MVQYQGELQYVPMTENKEAENPGETENGTEE